MTHVTTPSPNGREQQDEVETLKVELSSRIDQLIPELFGISAKRTNREYRIGSIHGESGASLAISRTGKEAGLWFDHNPAGSGSGDVLTLIQQAKNLSFKETLAWARTWLGAATSSTQGSHTDSRKISTPKPNNGRAANQEFLARRQKRLSDSRAALAWLEKRGINAKTTEFFRLGLSEEYVDRENVPHSDALVAPVINSDGHPLGQFVYYNIPGLTLNPAAANGWMKGPPRTYYSGVVAGHKTLFVCEGLKDLWRTWQVLREDGSLELLLISSTHGSAIPDEWQYASFWERFDLVFLGHDADEAGDETARRIAKLAGHEMLRVRPPKKEHMDKDWTDFWQGGTVDEFRKLLAEASVMSEEIAPSTETDTTLGRHDYKPVDIATAFHRGHLYYPVRTLNNALEEVKDERGNTVTRTVTAVETVVVRSDRTVHSVREEPAPKGTPPEERVLRLTDGTLIESRPKSSVYSTWSWASIKAYRDGKSKPRSLKTILSEVNTFLRQSVWLPYEHDYDLLTLLVPITYAQAVFQSVPMILVVGPPGSGKSALGRAMCRICANSASVGQVSAAGVARLIHETKGFVVLDDLESLGNRSGKDAPQFGELVQALKLSYNKETSWKIWTDVSRGMRVERLNFFGVKMVNNTSGADNILGSRMMRIQTRKLPEEMKSAFGVFEQYDPASLHRLRDELHTWTFENVALIDEAYKRLFPSPTDRASEIAAPLRVFAELSGEEKLTYGLANALETKSHSLADPDDPIEVMKEAMKRLVREGYKEVSTTHVVMEMRTLIDQNTDRHMTNEIVKWEDPAWVGRQLRTHDIIDSNSQGARQWLFGKSLRIYPIKDHFIAEVCNKAEDIPDYMERKPTDFCAGCSDCRYRSADCTIMESRLTYEKKKPLRSVRANH
jgi:energy-coupling factor transporter ATP-binding protein EcfA2